MIKLNSAYICVRNMVIEVKFVVDWCMIMLHKRDKILSIFLIHGFRLCLFENLKVGEKVTYGDSCLLSFEVDNIDKLIQKLEKLNAQIVFPLTKLASNWVLEFKDTEGNDVEVYSKIK